MGLPNWLHWMAWFVKSLVFILFTIILITFMLKVTRYNKKTGKILIDYLSTKLAVTLDWSRTASCLGKIRWIIVLFLLIDICHYEHFILLPHDGFLCER